MIKVSGEKMLTKDFDYHLPAELIAQEPALERSRSRLMLVHRATGAISHYHANDLPSLLQKGPDGFERYTRYPGAAVW